MEKAEVLPAAAFLCFPLSPIVLLFFAFLHHLIDGHL
jgi:hypothetical protein